MKKGAGVTAPFRVMATALLLVASVALVGLLALAAFALLIRRGRSFRRLLLDAGHVGGRRHGLGGARAPATPAAAAAAAASSSSAIAAFGICAEATVGFSLPPNASSTPVGRASERTWIECPIASADRSTSMNSAGPRPGSGRRFAQNVGDQAALLLDRGRFLRVDEVQRHLDVDLLVRRNSLEVDVLHFQLERMHVDRPQQHRFLRTVEGERQHRRVKLLVAHLVVQGVVLELDVDRGFLPP